MDRQARGRDNKEAESGGRGGGWGGEGEGLQKELTLLSHLLLLDEPSLHTSHRASPQCLCFILSRFAFDLKDSTDLKIMTFFQIK